MICEKCGAKNNDDSKFCLSCGEELAVQEAPQPAMQNVSVWPEWRIDQLLGAGSFGKVYKAKRVEYGETYFSAIKIISIPQNASEIQAAKAEGMDDHSVHTYFEGFVSDWVKEIKLMETLKATQNIVSIEDYKVIEKKDSIGWDIVLRMELLTGLNAYITEHVITKHQVIKLGMDICRALEFCQKVNIIHRDIKPENIFVSKFGDFKLGDFGVARQIERTTSGLSKKGTYTYMAPEVYLGGAYNASVDLYSLGMVLYRFLNNNRTAFLPDYPKPITFQDREQSTARRMAGEPIKPPCKAGEALSEIILKACAFNPADRYQNPAELREALEAALQSEEDMPVIYPTVNAAQNNTTTESDAASNRTLGIFGESGVESSTGRPALEKQPPEMPSETEYLTFAPMVFADPVNQTVQPDDTEAAGVDVIGTETSEDQDKEVSKPNKKRRKPFILIGAAALLVLVFGGAAFAMGMIGGGDGKDPEQVVIPNVIGEVGQEAVAMLEELGLQVLVTEVETKDEEAGAVFYQSIAADEKVDSGSKIDLKVAVSPKQAKVPAVVGFISDDALTALQQLGLSGSIIEQYSETIAAGKVISQSIAAGELLNIGSNVELLVSKGKEPASVSSTWSGWVSSLPSGVNSTDYYIESKTQYQYRDKEFTTSAASTLDGWTKYNETSVWGAWSGWSTTAVSASGTREVNTKQVANPQTYKTQYAYEYWRYWNSYYSAYYYKGNSNMGGTYYFSGWYDSPFTFNQNTSDGAAYRHNPTIYFSNELWFNPRTQQTPLPLTYHTEYQYRDKVFTYHFYRFKAWSSWQDSPVTATDDRQVRTQKLYRYKEK